MREKNSTKFLKSLRRYNGLPVLNITGLALGLAGVIYIAIWISHELSYDRYFRNSDRIYRVESLMNFTGEPFVWTVAPSPTAETFRNEFPEVEDAVRLKSGYREVVKAGDQIFSTKNLYYTDNSYFRIFSTRLVSGVPSGFLDGPAQVVISRDIARLLFGDKDPVGKTILLNNTDLLTVKGVIENSPSNTHLRIDYLISFSLLEKGGKKLESWSRFDFITYILLKKGSDAEKFNTKISDFLNAKNKTTNAKLIINPLTRIYLYRDPGFKSSVYPSAEKGPVTSVILFGIIGIVLLLIACINFINLSTAFATERAKEIGIRKVNGAGRLNLIMHLFGESLLQTTLATFLAIFIVILILPVFIKASGVELDLSKLLSVKSIAVYLALALVTGLISGIYPALVLSSFNPMKVIRPVPENIMQGSALRKTLVVIQFTLSIVFVFCIIVINRQISYMRNKDLGFNKTGVMVIYPEFKFDKVEILAEQIEKFPEVNKIAFGDNVPVRMGNFTTINKWDGNVSGKALRFHRIQVDDRYLDFFEIEVTKGNKFNTSSIGKEVIINETAAKRMEMEEPVGKTLLFEGERYTIIGVVRDFHYHKLKDPILPVIIFKDPIWRYRMIFIKLEKGKNLAAVEKIADLVNKSYPGFPPNYVILDQEVERYYEEERRLNTLLDAATILSIVISCIGLFSLTAFSIHRKQKEIGIRKAYGASVGKILFMFQKEFGILILISSCIALPAGYYIIKQWLNSYSYHIGISPLYFLATLLLIILIAVLTVAFHSLKAANLNPADTVRNE